MSTNKNIKTQAEPSLDTGIFTGESTEEFFNNLESNSNSNQATPSNNSSDSGANGEKGENDLERKIQSLTDKIKNVEERYGNSSAEAIKLREELNAIEPFKPIFDEMKQNPDLVRTMKEAIKSSKEPKSPIEALGLSEDFVFDPEEAIKDINSDSAKVIRYMGRIEAEAKAKELERLNESQRMAERQQNDFEKFVSTTKLDEKETENLKQYMKEHRLTLDDVYFLMKRKDIAKNIAERARAETLKQMTAANMLNGDSLGTTESGIPDTENDDKFFDSIFGEREKGIFG